MLTLFQSKLGKNVPPQHIFFHLVDLLDLFYWSTVRYTLYRGFPPFGLFCIFIFGSHQDHDGISTSLQSPSNAKCCWMLCCVYKTTGALDISEAFLFQQPTFICGERLKQKYSFLCYKACRDLTRIRWRESKKNNGERGSVVTVRHSRSGQRVVFGS